MKVGILGHGTELTPELADMTTMFPMLAHGMSRDFRPVLIQGSPGVKVTPEGKGMIIEWDALYGYYIPGSKSRHTLYEPTFNREKGWRDAAKFGHFAYRLALAQVGKLTKGPDKTKVNGAVNVPDMVEIATDEYYTLEDTVMDALDAKLMWQPGNIRESTGSYRWIGLGSRNPKYEFPGTKIVIPDVVAGTKPLKFTGHVTPFAQGADMPLTPRFDWCQTSTICGIIHAFADFQVWTPRVAIWAAHFQKIFQSGMMSIDKLFTAASRQGVTPRLSSSLQVQNTDMFYPAYNKLAALAITCRWFSRNYWGGMKGGDMGQHTWNDNVGAVRYWVSGTTPAAILQGKIRRFARANMTIFGTRESPGGLSGEGKSGLYYFPVNNYAGAFHRLAFAATPQEANAKDIDLLPSEEPRLYAKLNSETLILDKNLVLNMTDDQAQTDAFYPVNIELSRSVTQVTKFLPLGLRMYVRMVRDLADPEIARPLDLLKTMMVGWNLMYSPSSAIFSGASVPSTLDEFSDFSVIPGASYVPGRS